MPPVELNEPGTVSVRYWAGARAAAGVESEQYAAEAGLTLAGLLAQIEARHGETSRLTRALATCSFLVDDQPVGRSHAADHHVPPGATVEVLPPFAGG